MAMACSAGHLIATGHSLLSDPPDQWAWLPAWLRARLPSVPSAPRALGPTQRIVHNTVVTLNLGG